MILFRPLFFLPISSFIIIAEMFASLPNYAQREMLLEIAGTELMCLVMIDIKDMII